jgi:ABC-2 type transport system permease protein
MTLLGTVLIWFYASGAELNQDFRTKISYFILGTIYFGVVNMWPSFFGYNIRDGKHTILLLRPGNFIVSVFFIYLGVASFQMLVLMLLFLFSSPIWILFVSSTVVWQNIFWLILMWLPSILIHFFLEFLVAMLAFFVTEINGIILNFDFLKSLLMGRLIPLTFIISSFWIGLANPFGFLFFQPMQILLGKYDTNQIIITLISSLLWIVFLTISSNYILKIGLKKNESVGL